VPPLRDRKEDILPLAHTLLHRVPGFESAEIPADLAIMLTSYPWPGNVRELRNVLERYTVLGANAAAMFDGGIAVPSATNALAHLPYHEARRVTLDQFERAYLPAVLERANGVISRAALLAQIGRGSFHRMLGRIRTGNDADE
jgi:DNA-binding NtrC family response regulator